MESYGISDVRFDVLMAVKIQLEISGLRQRTFVFTKQKTST
jgi:hypothetical protein